MTRDLPVQPGPNLLDLAAAMAGAEQADANADSWWRDGALRAVEHLASTGREFTADDLRDLGVPEPDNSARWGALFLAAARAGTVVCVGARRSTRGPRHGSLVRVWRGKEAAA